MFRSAATKTLIPLDVTDQVIWTLDLMKELGVSPHNLAASSPLVLDDLVFVVTGNGVDESAGLKRSGRSLRPVKSSYSTSPTA